jgi:hypothetical protein
VSRRWGAGGGGGGGGGGGDGGKQPGATIYFLEPIVFGLFVQSMAPQSSEALVSGSVGPLATCIPGHDGHPPPINVDEEEEEEEKQDQHCVYLY